MNYTDAEKLKKGDLVVTSDKQSKRYAGLVLEVESINPKHDHLHFKVTLKQPGFDLGFRVVDYDSRRLKRYEP